MVPPDCFDALGLGVAKAVGALDQNALRMSEDISPEVRRRKEEGMKQSQVWQTLRHCLYRSLLMCGVTFLEHFQRILFWGGNSHQAALKLCHALFLSRRVDEKSVPQAGPGSWTCQLT